MYAMDNNSEIENYYKKQHKVYDITRPLFLFGRDELVDIIQKRDESGKLLEIGCGTGYLLRKLESTKSLQLYGIDLTQEMLNKAKKNLSSGTILTHCSLEDYANDEKFDIIVLSYTFTINLKEFTNNIIRVKKLLKKGGRLYVVDFHRYGNKLYKQYMNWHGINMSTNLLEELQNNFKTEVSKVKSAYFGLWEYFVFVGKNA